MRSLVDSQRSTAHDRTFKLLKVAFALLLILATPARADQPDETLPFFQPGQAFDAHGADTINLFNGDVNIPVPLGPSYTLGPTGFRFQLEASYSAKFWHFSSSTCNGTPKQFAWVAGDPSIGVGWSLLLGYVVKRIPPTGSAYWEYYSPDGGTQRVDLAATNPSITKDGSHLRITALPNATSPTSYTVEFPDGTLQTFNHAYTAPASTPASADFRNIDYGEPAQTRYGLGTIKDRFNNTLVTVNWSGANPSEVSSITLNPFGSTITFTWASYGVGGVSWRVIDNIVFPAPSFEQLRADFDYVPGTFARHTHDNSAGATGCTASGPIAVPELSAVTFSDPTTPDSNDSMSAFSYGFAYWASAGATVQKQGTLEEMTLPTHGTVSYDYDITAGPACTVGAPPMGCDPAAALLTVEPPDDPDAPAIGLADRSPGVISRTEYDPFTARSVVTTYARKHFRGGSVGFPDPDRAFRRTTVIGPGNDVGAGSTQYARRYYFHVDNPDGAQKNSNGIELDRRYFPGSDVTQTPVRTEIRCYQGKCGYQAANGTIHIYSMASDRTPAEKIVTWYGATPAGQEGGTCTAAYSTKCVGVLNTNYNATAGEYDTTTVTSNLTGSSDRTVDTNWIPATATGHWILDLFDKRFTWNGASLPSGSNGSSVVRQYFDFDPATGFLEGSWTWDSLLGKAIQTCNYKNANGTPLNSFTQTYNSAGEPTTTSCPGSIPSVGTDGDSFGKSYTSTSLLVTQSNWRKGASSIGWNSLDLVRDLGTGHVVQSRDPSWSLAPGNNELRTSYTYDSLGRVVKIQPPGGSAVEWPTTVCHLPATGIYTDFVIIKKVTASPTLGPNGSACARDDGVPGANSGPVVGYHYDGLGRVVREVRRHHKALATGSYFAVRDTRYDSAGHRIFLSEWRACNTSSGATHIGSCVDPQQVNPVMPPPDSTAWSNFDPFGRGQRAIGPNNSSDITVSRTDGTISFSDSREVVTVACVNGTWSGSTCNGGSSAVTTNVVDPLGRLRSVTEPGGDLTNYSYNVLDKLTSVDQGAADRTFVWSAFGFLKTEQTPENGVSGYATTNYFNYGSLGNLKTKTDGLPLETNYSYTYDAASRVTRLQAGGVDYVLNCYDGSALDPTCDDGTPNYSGGSYPNGRLTRRVGWNYIPYEAVPVTDDFNHSHASGRLTSQITSLGTIGKPGFGAPVTETWTYNTFGLAATHSHPRAAGAPTSMTDTSSFTAGFLTSLTGAYQSGSLQVATANYQAWGGLADYRTNPGGSFVTTTVTPNALVPSRPGRIFSGPSGSPLFDTGTYNYDGAGSVKAMGSDSFSYDTRSRLTQAVYAGVGGGTQGFTYDRNGNLTSKTGVNALSIPTTASTNHITGATYDDRGNFVSLNAVVVPCQFTSETLCYDLVNRQYRNLNGTLGTDFTYLYDGAGERIAKFQSNAGAQRREMARDVIEARGDTVPACTDTQFADASCAANPNDGKFIEKIRKTGISAGCGGGNFCPNTTMTREQAAVFFVKGKYCPLNGTSGTCPYTPPACTGVFADVPCPSQYADYIEKLAADGVTTGCGGGNYCPLTALTSWQMMAWLQLYWSNYNPLPRSAIVTFRDGSRLTTEAQAVPADTDASAIFTYTRDNFFFGYQLMGSALWSGTTPGWHLYASDHLGTPRLTMSTAGTEVEERRFWPYGDPGSVTGGGSGQRLKLGLMELDDETTHYYDHARYEGWTLGRFLTREPVWSGFATSPQSWNAYSYAGNNPTTLADPDGNIPIFVAVGVLGGLYTGITAGFEHYGETGDLRASFGRGALGFGAGFVGGVVGSLSGNAFAAGAVTSTIDQLFSPQPFSVEQVVLSGAFSATSGGIAGHFGPRPGSFLPKIGKWRPVSDYVRKPNVRRTLIEEGLGGLIDSLTGAGVEAARARVKSNGVSLESVFGPGYQAFQLFLFEFQQQLEFLESAPETPSGEPFMMLVIEEGLGVSAKEKYPEKGD